MVQSHTALCGFESQNQCEKPGWIVSSLYSRLGREGRWTPGPPWPLGQFLVSFRPLGDSASVLHTHTNMDTQALCHDLVYTHEKNSLGNGQLSFTRVTWHSHVQ